MSKPFLLTNAPFAAEGEDAPLLEAPRISGPDGDGYVWACGRDGSRQWCTNLGSAESVREGFEAWLASQRERR